MKAKNIKDIISQDSAYKINGRGEVIDLSQDYSLNRKERRKLLKLKNKKK